METFVDGIRELFSGYGLDVLAALAILVVGWFCAKVLTRVGRRIMTAAGTDPTLVGFAANLLYITLLAIVVITGLDKLGVPAISFVGVLGAAGLAVGLALKGALSDLAAGVMLIVFRPFRVGDRIEAAGVSGVVSEIHVFATTVDASDNKKIIIPNSAITGGNITNYSTA